MVEAGATENGYRLVQGGAPASDEETVARGLEEAKDHIGTIIDLQLELRRQLGEPEPVEWPVVEDYSAEMYERVAASPGPSSRRWAPSPTRPSAWAPRSGSPRR